MKKLYSSLLILSLPFLLLAQAPQGFNYQAIVRNSTGNPITDQTVGIQVSIIQTEATGTVVYVERFSPTTNDYGLINIKIGTGDPQTGTFNSIDWSNGPYFLKMELDKDGGTSYTELGTNQLLSVPYALYAQTVTSYTETDPEFNAWDKSTDILITESQISDLGTYLETETDPAVEENFDFTDAANGDLLQFDGTKWVKLTPDYISDYTVTESDVTAHQEALAVTESQITDLQDYATSTELSTGLDGKVDKEAGKSLQAEGTQTGEIQYWNGSEWVTVSAGNEGQVLTFTGGVPTWKLQLQDGEVRNPTTGEVWMDRNLGASQVATASDDENGYGDLYQWGRSADGHESRTSDIYDGDANGKPSTYNENGAWDGKFITTGTILYDWLDPQNDNLWQGASGTNNPCPDGYRLPTAVEWESERTSWSSNDAAGAFESPLKLPLAGDRYTKNGLLFNVGSFGSYWSSTVDGTISGCLFFYSIEAHVTSGRRADGLSVRCIKD